MSKVTREKCAEIIHEFEPSTEAKLLRHLGIDGRFKQKEKQKNKSYLNKKKNYFIFRFY